MTIDIKSINASGNGEDGVRIEEGAGPVKIGALNAHGNAGKGLNIVGRPDDRSTAADPWYKRPLGIVWLSVAGTSLAAALAWAVRHYLT